MGNERRFVFAAMLLSLGCADKTESVAKQNDSRSQVPASQAPSPQSFVYVGHTELPTGDFVEVGSSCARRRDGELLCWAVDLKGDRAKPPAGKYAKLSMRDDFGCAITQDGKGVCFSARLSFGPQPRAPKGKLKAISAARSGVCAITSEGEARCNGEIKAPKGRFVDVFCTSYRQCCAAREEGGATCWGAEGLEYAGTETFTTIETTYDQACGITEDHRLICWGEKAQQQKGNFVDVSLGGTSCAMRGDGSSVCWEKTTRPSRTAAKLPWRVRDFNADGTCAALLDGRLVCWGYGWIGPIPNDILVDIDGGDGGFCGLTDSGEIRCWTARIDSSQLSSAPTTNGFTNVEVGGHGCAEHESGGIRCWGGQFGTPKPPAGRFNGLSTGNDSCALDADDKAVCWDTMLVPSKLLGAFKKISAGGNVTTCGLTKDGEIRCDGLEIPGILEDRMGKHRPPGGRFIDIDVGYEHACAIEAAGSAVCWGRSTRGETSPPDDMFIQLALGEKRSCGLTKDRRVRCWGGRPKAAPQERFTQIAMTDNTDLPTATFVCGLRERDRRVQCWHY